MSTLAGVTRGSLAALAKPTKMWGDLRAWDMDRQADVEATVASMLEQGMNVDAVDTVSGCTVMHYAVKSGARYFGDDEKAATLVSHLILRGADPNQACKFLQMTPLHYAAYFGCDLVIGVLAKSKSRTGHIDLHSKTPSHDGATALHLAVAHVNYLSVKALLAANHNCLIRNDSGSIPLDVALELKGQKGVDETELDQIIEALRRFAESCAHYEEEVAVETMGDAPRNVIGTGNEWGSDTSSVYSSSGVGEDGAIEVGDRVNVRGKGTGLVRFKGSTKFKPGTWYGVQMDRQVGKNNGTVGLISYFRTKPLHGVFVRRARLEKIDDSAAQLALRSNLSTPYTPNSMRRSKSPSPFSTPTFNTRSTFRADNGVASDQSRYSFTARSAGATPRTSPAPGPHISDTTSPFGPLVQPFGLHSRVLVRTAVGPRMGLVVYIGRAHLGPGTYIGVEVTDTTAGKHDGMVDGKRYFKCGIKCGLLLPVDKVTWHGHNVADVLTNQKYNLASPKEIYEAEREKGVKEAMRLLNHHDNGE